MRQEHRVTPNHAPRLRAVTLAAGLAALALAGAELSVKAAAQSSSPPLSTPREFRDQLRDRAPIGHRQPRPQDLPPNVRRDERGSIGPTSEERDLDKKLEICRRC
jgi:hypothetical protein